MSASLLGYDMAADRQRLDAALARAVGRAAADTRTGAAVRYAVEGGGKRVRPLLCVAAYRAFRSPVPDAVYDLAAAIELIHAYSLAHDDLPSMDDDPLRRGRASTHVAHGVAAATVAGAALIPLAARVARDAAEALGLPASGQGTVVAALMAAAGAGGMVGGQVLDLEAEDRAVSTAELDRIHRAKTGALLAASPVLGGLAAGADAAALDALEACGAALGLAFQITDDILDRTASSDRLGKTAGRDAHLAKATYASVVGMEQARARADQEVARALAALAGVGIDSEEMSALARFVAERDR